MIRSYYYNSHSDRWIAGHSPHGESREPDLSCVKGIITENSDLDYLEERVLGVVGSPGCSRNLRGRGIKPSGSNIRPGR